MLKNKIILKKIRNILILGMISIVVLGVYNNIRNSKAEENDDTLKFVAELNDINEILDTEEITIDAIDNGDDTYTLILPKFANGKGVLLYNISKDNSENQNSEEDVQEELPSEDENLDNFEQQEIIVDKSVIDNNGNKIQFDVLYDKKEAGKDEEKITFYNKELNFNDELKVKGYMPEDAELEVKESDVSTVENIKLFEDDSEISKDELEFKKVYDISINTDIEKPETSILSVIQNFNPIGAIGNSDYNKKYKPNLYSEELEITFLKEEQAEFSVYEIKDEEKADKLAAVTYGWDNVNFTVNHLAKYIIAMKPFDETEQLPEVDETPNEEEQQDNQVQDEEMQDDQVQDEEQQDNQIQDGEQQDDINQEDNKENQAGEQLDSEQNQVNDNVVIPDNQDQVTNKVETNQQNDVDNKKIDDNLQSDLGTTNNKITTETTTETPIDENSMLNSTKSNQLEGDQVNSNSDIMPIDNSFYWNNTDNGTIDSSNKFTIHYSLYGLESIIPGNDRWHVQSNSASIIGSCKISSYYSFGVQDRELSSSECTVSTDDNSIIMTLSWTLNNLNELNSIKITLPACGFYIIGDHGYTQYYTSMAGQVSETKFSHTPTTATLRSCSNETTSSSAFLNSPSGLTRGKISSVEFTDSIFASFQSTTYLWDVSANGDGSIMA